MQSTRIIIDQHNPAVAVSIGWNIYDYTHFLGVYAWLWSGCVNENYNRDSLKYALYAMFDKIFSATN